MKLKQLVKDLKRVSGFGAPPFKELGGWVPSGSSSSSKRNRQDEDDEIYKKNIFYEIINDKNLSSFKDMWTALNSAGYKDLGPEDKLAIRDEIDLVRSGNTDQGDETLVNNAQVYLSRKNTSSAKINTDGSRVANNVIHNIDLYKVFLENYGLIENYNDQIINNDIRSKASLLWDIQSSENFEWVFLKKQAKWLICFNILFYLDFLHDFIADTKRTSELTEDKKQQLTKQIYDKLQSNIISISNLLVGYYISNKIKVSYKVNTDTVLEDIFENTPPQRITYTTVDGLQINLDEEIYNYIIMQKEPPTFKGEKGGWQVAIQVRSERCIILMGIQKLSLGNFETQFGSSGFSKDESFINRLIMYYNRLNPDPSTDRFAINTAIRNNILNSNFPYFVAADSLIKAEKWTNLTKPVYDAIKRGQPVVYAGSNIDILDGAAHDNSIRKQIPDKDEPTFADIRFVLEFSWGGLIITPTPVMDLQVINNTRTNKLIINRFFNIIESPFDSFEEIGNITLSPRNIVSKFSRNAKKNAQLSCFKTALDFLKILYHFTYINVTSLNPDQHALMVFSDIVAADKAALFYKHASVEEGESQLATLYERPYIYFLRNWQLERITNLYFDTSSGTNYKMVEFGKKRAKRFIQEVNRRSALKGAPYRLQDKTNYSALSTEKNRKKIGRGN